MGEGRPQTPGLNAGRSEAPRSDSALRILGIDANHGKAVGGNMLLVAWKKLTTTQACVQLTADVGDLARRRSGGFGILQVLEVDATPPDTEAREEVLKFLKFCDGHVKHHSIVYEGTGFRAATVRAIVSSFYLFARPSFPHKVFNSLSLAAAWHAQQEREQRQSNVNAQSIIDNVQALRARVNQGV
jgi:hypothetical protein